MCTSENINGYLLPFRYTKHVLFQSFHTSTCSHFEVNQTIPILLPPLSYHYTSFYSLHLFSV